MNLEKVDYISLITDLQFLGQLLNDRNNLTIRVHVLIKRLFNLLHPLFFNKQINFMIIRNNHTHVFNL